MPFIKGMVSEPTELAKELGVGPTLFLMSTRAMAILFMVLTVLNIPLFAFYYAGTKNADTGGSGTKADSFDDYFALFSLGNTGSSGYSCNGISMQCFELNG